MNRLCPGRDFPSGCSLWRRRLPGGVNPHGVLEATGEDPATVIGRIRQQLDQAPGSDDWVVWGRWFLADRATRTISPFSKVTIPEHRQRESAM